MAMSAAEAKPLRIIISGASGLIGTRLAAFLGEQGHRVDRLGRSAPRAGSTDIRWDPARGEIEAGKLEAADAVVNLAGENIGQKRWTEVRKRAILESRVSSTRLLSETIARLKKPPRVLVSASAVGYYGDRGEEKLTEESQPGQGFLAEVCRAWESATGPAAAAGVRVVILRQGLVLAGEGGALAAMLLPFKLGAGGPLGSGRQSWSWIALSDLVEIYLHVITHENLAGPVNAVAPNPASNAEFAKTLGQVLHRPALLRLPAFAIRLIFGEMGQELFLDSASVFPAMLTAPGFQFSFPRLEVALKHEIRRTVPRK